MEGISLFGVTPSLRAIPAGGFVISTSHLTSETPPVAGGALMLEETHAQAFAESESVVDLGVGTADRDIPAEGADASAVDVLAGSDHLENIGRFEFPTYSFFFLVVECHIWKKFHFIWGILFS
jgi:hypothetical protein